MVKKVAILANGGDVSGFNAVIKKNIKTARIYPTQVFKNTALYGMYLSGEYKAADLADMILAAGGMYAHFTAENVQVIRMGLPVNAAENSQIAAGAYHKSFGDIVKTFIMLLYMDMGYLFCLK